MKYATLTDAELSELKEDFIQFLAANTVTGPDWEKIKIDEVEKAHQLIDVFSDIIWEKTLSNIKSLERRSKNSLTVFHFGEKEAEMIHIDLPQYIDFDFTNAADLKKLDNGTSVFADLEPEIIKGTNVYQSERNLLIFMEMNKGAQPCKEVFFYGLKKIVG